MGKKLYTRDTKGGIRFSSDRKPGEVRIPNYVFDMWLPLVGTDAIALYSVYCRLERAEVVKAITVETIAKCCRMSKTTVGKLNDVLTECGFINIKKPVGNARAHHMTNEITVKDPPRKISPALIAKYQPESGYVPLSTWLIQDESEVPDSTSRSTTEYHEAVLDSTSTMLQPSVLQPLEVELPASVLKWNSTHFKAFWELNKIVLGVICAAVGLDLTFKPWDEMTDKERVDYVETCQVINVSKVDIEAYVKYLKKEFSWRKPFKLSLGDFNKNISKFQVALHRASQPKIITGVWGETDAPEIKDVGLTSEQRRELIASTKKAVSA